MAVARIAGEGVEDPIGNRIVHPGGKRQRKQHDQIERQNRHQHSIEGELHTCN
jgi:hypothetical protein